MDIIVLSLRSITPIFGIIFIGCLTRYVKLISENDAKKLNMLCFYVFLPALCFDSTYKNAVDISGYTRQIGFIIVVFCALTILTFLKGLIYLAT